MPASFQNSMLYKMIVKEFFFILVCTGECLFYWFLVKIRVRNLEYHKHTVSEFLFKVARKREASNFTIWHENNTIQGLSEEL